MIYIRKEKGMHLLPGGLFKNIKFFPIMEIMNSDIVISVTLVGAHRISNVLSISSSFEFGFMIAFFAAVDDNDNKDGDENDDEVDNNDGDDDDDDDITRRIVPIKFFLITKF